jgi:hypothetical protein
MKSSPGEERDQSFSLLACNIQTNLRHIRSPFQTKFTKRETRQWKIQNLFAQKPHPSGTRPWYTHKNLNTWTSSSYVPHRSTIVWIASITKVSIRLPHLWQYRKNYTPKQHPYTSLKQNCGCGYEKKQQFSTRVLLSSFPIRGKRAQSRWHTSFKFHQAKWASVLYFQYTKRKGKKKQRNTHLPILRHTVAPSPSGCARDNNLLTTTLGLLNSFPVPLPLSALSIIPLTWINSLRTLNASPAGLRAFRSTISVDEW